MRPAAPSVLSSRLRAKPPLASRPPSAGQANFSSRSRVRGLAFERGFTLVELLTVVAIAAVLATIGTMLVRRHFAHAKTTEAVATIQAIRQAEEARRGETGTYQTCSAAAGKS